MKIETVLNDGVPSQVIADDVLTLSATSPDDGQGFSCTVDVTLPGASAYIVTVLYGWWDAVNKPRRGDWNDADYEQEAEEREQIRVLADELAGKRRLTSVRAYAEGLGVTVAAEPYGAILRSLRRDAEQIAEATESRRKTARVAFTMGVQKSEIAKAAGVTRATLDKWIADAQ